ncbi:MAG: Gfo/Idh/MocA family oxidoreductase [Abitibacteriaceae bacterium]|nr:Gfo/Idh/MocA family oxidoreductase [Abditibacteriaceae bacterium]MBV9868039.1 Gfo/Idh/MocA family oxidoreductase [Abditibacteriaceae bacterium]
MAKIKVGIIGCGGRGREHAAGYAASEQVQIVAVADPVKESAQTLAEKHGASGVYEDYQQMLKEQQLDMVSVCTWTGQHHQQVLDTVAAGAKAINCEKPMAPTWGESREIHQAAEKAGVQMTFCHQRRFLAQFIKARELAQSGAVGKLIRFEGFCPNLFDWGTHWFDMFFFYNNETPAKWVMGQIELRDSRTVFAVPVESQGLSYIEFENGVHGLMITGREVWGGCATRIIGTEGIIEVPTSDGEQVRLLRNGGKGWETPSLADKLPQRNATVLSILDAIDCFQSGREPELSSRKAYQATELIFATYESARRRGRIDLPLEIEDSPLISMLNAQQDLPV